MVGPSTEPASVRQAESRYVCVGDPHRSNGRHAKPAALYVTPNAPAGELPITHYSHRWDGSELRQGWPAIRAFSPSDSRALSFPDLKRFDGFETFTMRE